MKDHMHSVRGERVTASNYLSRSCRLFAAAMMASCTGIPAASGQTPSVNLTHPATVPERVATKQPSYNGTFAGEYLDRVAFPLGGLGAGMVCIEGSGALSHVSLRHKPEVFKEPMVFAAVSVKNPAHVPPRVLEGPVPSWKLFGPPETGLGAPGKTFGLPRFDRGVFTSRFPFAGIELTDANMPFDVTITAWSPFEPNEADNSSLPVAALEYTFKHRGNDPVEAVFSFNSCNLMALQEDLANTAIRPISGGYVLCQEATPNKPWEAGAFCVRTPEPGVKVNHAWFRGGFYDALTMTFKDVQTAACYDRPPVTQGPPAPGASLFVPFTLRPGESRTIVVQLSWFVGESGIRYGDGADSKTKDENYTGLPSHRPWYSSRFADIAAVSDYWHEHYGELRANSRRFSDCLYATTLPDEVMQAVASNLTVLKSPTILRQADGRLWGWEGCNDSKGSCYGSCTHVWNYAQAIPHLFPALERGLRETEYHVSQDAQGHQAFRTPIPIRTPLHDFHAAADGQLGGIIKVYREWRISGDTAWLREMWPAVRSSLDYAIRTWDPQRKGAVEEPHHNTYDIEFWGPEGMAQSFYVCALQAAILMGKTLGQDVAAYDELLRKGKAFTEKELFNGEYFEQKIQWKGMQAGSPTEVKTFGAKYSPEALDLLNREGPRYQFGKGCLTDGVLGEWIAAVSGLPGVLDGEKVHAHLRSVYRYNLKKDLSAHINPQRPGYACGHEGGLLLCTWPRGEEPSLPFIYSNEVWIGIEYQAAAHMIMTGMVEEGLDVVRTCLDRYDGRVRNPFNQYECGHWYARAMASYALLQAMTGIRFDAVDEVLYIAPKIKGDFQCFFSTATGYGLAGVKNNSPFHRMTQGSLAVKNVQYTPVSGE